MTTTAHEHKLDEVTGVTEETVVDMPQLPEPEPESEPESEPKPYHFQTSVPLNQTQTHQIEDYGFGNLPKTKVAEIYKDGRAFSHLIEPWLAANYPLEHVPGCKGYDFKDANYPETLYDAKTFTKGGCSYCPSNMLGMGRKFDAQTFKEKTEKLIFCVVSNINFPEIKVKFIAGTALLVLYPRGKIPPNDFIKFFN